MNLKDVWRRLWSRLTTVFQVGFARPPSQLRPKVFVVVEGPHDIDFLRRISTILHASDRKVPDLADMERRQELVFVPTGGGDSLRWAFRLASLGRPEFHLFDRDVPPETIVRQQAADLVNWRAGCKAVLTEKRTLENYLSSTAIFEASGLRVAFSYDDHVADLVARAAYERSEGHVAWDELPSRLRHRRHNRVKHWLSTSAADRMTPDRLAERDPKGEVRSWLMAISQLANGSL